MVDKIGSLLAQKRVDSSGWSGRGSNPIARLALTLLIVAAPELAEAGTFEIAYRSIERLIVTYLMTDGGRFYLEGDPSTPCKYAFVQEPRVDAVSGRLRITLLFSGRAAVSVRGECVGAGDNFDIYISGVPDYSAGEMYLNELSVESSGSAYFKVVAPLLRRTLEKQLRVPLKEGLERASAYASNVGRLTFDELSVDQIVAGEDALRMSIDFAAALRPPTH